MVLLECYRWLLIHYLKAAHLRFSSYQVLELLVNTRECGELPPEEQQRFKAVPHGNRPEKGAWCEIGGWTGQEQIWVSTSLSMTVGSNGLLAWGCG